MRRLLSLALIAAAATLAPALRAQTTATQQVPITIKVPFTLQRLYPSVTEIEFSCMMYVAGSTSTVGAVVSPKISLAQLPKGADGTISGEATAAGTVTVPATAAGKGGSYRCLPYGCVNGSCWQLSEYSNGGTEYRLIATSGKIAEGTFIW